MPDSVYDSLVLAISEKMPTLLVFDKLISNRRNTTVIKLFDTSSSQGIPNNYYALKFSDINSDTAKVIQNEAVVLQDLREFSNHLYCASGEAEGQYYLLTQWLDGKRLSHVVREISAIDDVRGRHRGWLELSLTLANKVHSLHTLGYLHYDIQPEHFRIVEDELQLFDFGLSYSNDSLNVLYKGGLVHYQSPEVCKQLIENDIIIEYNVSSEVYAVAATLFFLYTNHTVFDYDYDLPLKEKWQIIATREPQSFADVRAEAFPEFEVVLQTCLSSDSNKRTGDLSQMITALEKVLHSYSYSSA